ncbi:MAG: DUF2723 domain-containing protein [Chlorobi bacterium]|nr:DUF2723 domain-containing protein [Chlorobiota bacterium]
MEIIKKYYAEITGLFVLAVYLLTLAPGIVEIDSGELTTAQIILGIAHPTGYPLFTMLGYLWSLLPLPFSAVYQANLLAALFTAGSVVLFVNSARMILDTHETVLLSTGKGKKKKSKETVKEIALSGDLKSVVSVSAGLLLAFSVTYWKQSASVEVYSLHILLTNAVIFFLLKAYFCENKEENLKYWMLFAVALAFGFSNHMTTILILPGTAFLYFAKEKFSGKSFKQIGLMLSAFFPILALIYAYLPLRAAQSPLLNWGNPVNFENFFRHVSGKQYRVWLFSSSDAAKKHLAEFFGNLPSEFAYLGLIPVIVGLWFAFKQNRKAFYFFLINFFATVFYSINYDIHDLDTYFLLAYVSLAFFGAYGFAFLFEKFGKTKLSFAAAGALVGIVLVINFSKTDRSGTYVYEDYTKAVLSSVPKNAVILSYQWDYWVSPSYYFRFVENFRPDVRVVDKELLRRSWYYHQLETEYPGIFVKLKEDVNGFLKAVQPFERDENYNSALLDKFYKRIMAGIVTVDYGKREAFIGPELFENEMRRGEFVLPEGFFAVPYHFLFKIVKGKEYVPETEMKFKLRFPQQKDDYADVIRRTIFSTRVNRAVYEVQYGRVDKAERIIAEVKKMFPELTIDPRIIKMIKNAKR